MQNDIYKEVFEEFERVFPFLREVYRGNDIPMMGTIEDFIHTHLVPKSWVREVEQRLKVDMVSKVEADDFVSQVVMKEVEKHQWSHNQALSDFSTALLGDNQAN